DIGALEEIHYRLNLAYETAVGLFGTEDKAKAEARSIIVTIKEIRDLNPLQAYPTVSEVLGRIISEPA
ncbi:MAG: hypothetical protein AAB267_00005, partial [Candidatus Desantisbacteria bacterium]